MALSAQDKALLAALDAPTKKVSAAQFLPALDAYQGVAHTPGQIGMGPPPPKSAASSAWGGLKNLGSGALKVLSVPQAAVFTLATKAGHHLSGGAIKDASWKGLGGGFYSGYKGGYGVLDAFGVKNEAVKKWAGLGVDIVADPLWFAVPAKVTKIGGKAFDVGTDAHKAAARAQKIEGLEKAIKKARGGNRVKLKEELKALEAGPFNPVTDLRVDKTGTITNVARVAEKRLDAVADEFVKPAAQYGVRFGTKKHGKTVPLPFHSKAKDLSSGGGKVPKIRHTAGVSYGNAVERVVKDMGNGVKKMWRSKADRMGATDVKARRVMYLLDQMPADEAAKVLDRVEKSGLLPKEQLTAARKFLRDGKMEMRRTAKAEGMRSDRDVIKLIKQHGGIDEYKKANPAGFGPDELADEIRKMEQAQIRWDTGIEYLPRRVSEETDHAMHLLSRRMREAGVDANAAQLQSVRKEFEGMAKKRGWSRAEADDKWEAVVKDLASLNSTKAKEVMPLLRRHGLGRTNPFYERSHLSILDSMTPDTLAKALDDDDIADLFVSVLGRDRFADKPKTLMQGMGEKVDLVPELDPAKLIGDRLAQSIKVVANRKAGDTVERFGLKGTQLGRFITDKANTAWDPALMGDSKLWRFAQQGVGALKFGYTTLNMPGHYMNNAIGDARNAMVTGSWKHLRAFGASIPFNSWKKVAAGETEAMNKMYKLGGRMVSGDELFAISSVVGLGHGISSAEIAEIVPVLHNSRNIFGKLSRVNDRREAAQRLSTFVKHVQSGADWQTAVSKTIKVHFDYSDLTPFEKRTMRNVVIFYTWIRKNIPLQVYGMATRPAYYNTLNALSRATPLDPNAPAYMQEMTFFPTPIGSFSIADPLRDIHKFELSGENFRQTVLGSMNPLFRVPLELNNNKEFFSGRTINNRGLPTPHLLATLLSKAGVPVDQVSKGKGEQAVPGLNPYLAYLLNQATGPLGGMGAAFSKPADGTNPFFTEAGKRFGIKLYQPQTELWAKYAESNAKREAQDAGFVNNRRVVQ